MEFPGFDPTNVNLPPGMMRVSEQMPYDSQGDITLITSLFNRLRDRHLSETDRKNYLRVIKSHLKELQNHGENTWSPTFEQWLHDEGEYFDDSEPGVTTAARMPKSPNVSTSAVRVQTAPVAEATTVAIAPSPTSEAPAGNGSSDDDGHDDQSDEVPEVFTDEEEPEEETPVTPEYIDSLFAENVEFFTEVVGDSDRTEMIDRETLREHIRAICERANQDSDVAISHTVQSETGMVIVWAHPVDDPSRYIDEFRVELIPVVPLSKEQISQLRYADMQLTQGADSMHRAEHDARWNVVVEEAVLTHWDHRFHAVSRRLDTERSLFLDEDSIDSPQSLAFVGEMIDIGKTLLGEIEEHFSQGNELLVRASIRDYLGLPRNFFDGPSIDDSQRAILESIRGKAEFFLIHIVRDAILAETKRRMEERFDYEVNEAVFVALREIKPDWDWRQPTNLQEILRRNRRLPTEQRNALAKELRSLPPLPSDELPMHEYREKWESLQKRAGLGEQLLHGEAERSVASVVNDQIEADIDVLRSVMEGEDEDRIDARRAAIRIGARNYKPDKKNGDVSYLQSMWRRNKRMYVRALGARGPSLREEFVELSRREDIDLTYRKLAHMSLADRLDQYFGEGTGLDIDTIAKLAAGKVDEKKRETQEIEMTSESQIGAVLAIVEESNPREVSGLLHKLEEAIKVLTESVKEESSFRSWWASDADEKKSSKKGKDKKDSKAMSFDEAYDLIAPYINAMREARGKVIDRKGRKAGSAADELASFNEQVGQILLAHGVDSEKVRVLVSNPNPPVGVVLIQQIGRAVIDTNEKLRGYARTVLDTMESLHFEVEEEQHEMAEIPSSTSIVDEAKKKKSKRRPSLADRTARSIYEDLEKGLPPKTWKKIEAKKNPSSEPEKPGEGEKQPDYADYDRVNRSARDNAIAATNTQFGLTGMMNALGNYSGEQAVFFARKFFGDPTITKAEIVPERNNKTGYDEYFVKAWKK